MWSCENKSVVEASNDVSEKAVGWMGERLGAGPGNGLLVGIPFDEAWMLVAVAARLSDIVAVYNAPAYRRDVKDELKSIGERVTMFNKNDEFLAITSLKNVIT